MNACYNSFVYCIGHPTRRFIGSMEFYIVDMGALLEVASMTNTAMHINAQNQRMNLMLNLQLWLAVKGLNWR